MFFHLLQLLQYSLCSLCACDTPVQLCWSAGWRSAETSPCRCESGRCEPPRSAPHPPPHTWNKTVEVHSCFLFQVPRQSKHRGWMQILTGSWGSASSLSRCKGTWRWWAGGPAGRWGCHEDSDSLCHGYWETKKKRRYLVLYSHCWELQETHEVWDVDNQAVQRLSEHSLTNQHQKYSSVNHY